MSVFCNDQVSIRIHNRIIECRLATNEQITAHEGLVCVNTQNEDWPSLSIRIEDGSSAVFYLTDDTVRSEKLFRCPADDLKRVVSFVSGLLAWNRV